MMISFELRILVNVTSCTAKYEVQLKMLMLQPGQVPNLETPATGAAVRLQNLGAVLLL